VPTRLRCRAWRRRAVRQLAEARTELACLVRRVQVSGEHVHESMAACVRGKREPVASSSTSRGPSPRTPRGAVVAVRWSRCGGRGWHFLSPLLGLECLRRRVLVERGRHEQRADSAVRSSGRRKRTARRRAGRTYSPWAPGRRWLARPSRPPRRRTRAANARCWGRPRIQSPSVAANSSRLSPW
jgi:hypothetical protein